MSSPWDEMRATLAAAKDANKAADASANALVDILEGRLRHVSAYRLKRLKRELQNFDATKQRWKESA